jgi:hypothetical protein
MNGLFLLTILLQSDVSDPNRFNNFLVLGYGVMWFIAMIYVASLIVRQRNVQQDLQLMHRILQEDEETADS